MLNDVIDVANLTKRHGRKIAVDHRCPLVEQRIDDISRLRSDTTVPQWFDEGLAVVVSDDPRYLKSRSADDRCMAPPDGALPQTLDQWLGAWVGNG
ncbi:hypothetical protein E1193_08290 [Micromonospora sp. KC606]|uniref:hypothetical protein n=1 Tax=Micromonospora sp. KC606 TaxID=2530379 RepID=UPI0010524F77|nr:hypothetical protein [Micromonospora sp. KC606]TDC83557.1 hypothetical protein E1193_08290 [Micromonospora sp. KC606]